MLKWNFMTALIAPTALFLINANAQANSNPANSESTPSAQAVS